MGKNAPSTPHLWVEQGDEKIVRVASVAPLAPIDTLYSFAVPDSLAECILPGQRILAPFGRANRLAEGFAVEVSQRPWLSTLKYIDSAVDSVNYLNDELIALGEWMAEYYCAPLGITLSAMVPAAARDRSGFRTVRYIRLARPREDILNQATRLGPRQKLLLEALSETDEATANVICDQLGVSSATLRSAIRKGWVIERRVREASPAPNFDEPIVEPSFELSEQQRRAVAEVHRRIESSEFHVSLLYGVSGSGKTEVYIAAMKRVLARNRQVIVLVPEIALTTQLVHRFASRFTDLAVIHSGLTGTERSLTWNAIAGGEKRVIIGTRSAVFAPCRELGLIVIDEEQEPSYKNQQSPRFHARDVGIKRAQLCDIPVILGSATPALETWHNCGRKSHFSLLSLTQRVAGLKMPTVELVDMRDQIQSRTGHGQISRLLEQKLAAALQRREQAVLLLNRRGYAGLLYCPKCKRGVTCHHCKASMVFHRISGTSVCHHCYFKMPAPQQCEDPSCRSRLILLGSGTERVEAEVRRRFPDARVQRVDSDTMDNVREYERVLGAFEKREIDIMIGTQMIAKGLDFPFVSLVGVISADTGLFTPDFRANERTFQLITQVAGRAGRAHTTGEVVVQTLMSELPAIQAAMRHDYDAFARHELQTRSEMGMPPFSRLTRWILADKSESKAQAAAAQFAETVRAATSLLELNDATVSGPFPSALERIRNQYRYDVILRTPSAEQRSRVLNYLRREKRLRPAVQRLVVDVDPVSML